MVPRITWLQKKCWRCNKSCGLIHLCYRFCCLFYIFVIRSVHEVWFDCWSFKHRINLFLKKCYLRLRPKKNQQTHNSLHRHFVTVLCVVSYHVTHTHVLFHGHIYYRLTAPDNSQRALFLFALVIWFQEIIFHTAKVFYGFSGFTEKA